MAGDYTVNPDDIANEPVTGNGLSGAILSLAMGVLTVAVDGPGAMMSLPPNPVSTTSMTGTEATLTITWNDPLTVLAQNGHVTLKGLATTTPVDFLGIDANGVVQTSGAVPSSAGFKLDISPLSDSALGKIVAMEPVTFRMRPEYQGMRGDTERVGLIMENVTAVDPRLRYGDGWDSQAIIAILVKAVQELSSKVDDLNKKPRS